MANLDPNKFVAVMEQAIKECNKPAEAEMIELLKNNPNGNCIVFTNPKDWNDIRVSEYKVYMAVAVGLIEDKLSIKAYDYYNSDPNNAKWFKVSDFLSAEDLEHATFNAVLYRRIVNYYDQAMSKEAADQVSFEE